MLASARDVGQLIHDRQVAGPISLISFLSETQDRCRYLPRHALVFLSKTLGRSLSHTNSVATLYNAFSPKPRHASQILHRFWDDAEIGYATLKGGV